jgi:type IV pilus assembly protein PilE
MSTNRLSFSRAHPRAQQGFTLIELMVVVAIIGIIASIAYPSYKESVAKSRRADGQRALMEADQFMRRYFSARDSFLDTEDKAPTLPTALTKSPREGDSAYTIAFDGTPTQSTYKLKLTRTGPMASDRCGDLTVDQTGKKGVASGVKIEDCFKGF